MSRNKREGWYRGYYGKCHHRSYNWSLRRPHPGYMALLWPDVGQLLRGTTYTDILLDECLDDVPLLEGELGKLQSFRYVSDSEQEDLYRFGL